MTTDEQLAEYKAWSDHLSDGPRDVPLSHSNDPRLDAIRCMVDAALNLTGYLTLKGGYTGDMADYYAIRAGLRLVVEAMERRDTAVWKSKEKLEIGDEA